MLHTIKKVEYIDRYNLKLYFTNGKVKVFDMEDRLRNAKNLFLPLKDVEFFKKVKCEDGTIVWPNGVDLCPDVLYKSSRDLPKEKRMNSKAAVPEKRHKKKLSV